MSEIISNMILQINFDIKDLSKKDVYNETDIMIFILDKNGKLSDDNFIFYNNPSSSDNSIKFLSEKKKEYVLDINLPAIKIDLKKVDKNKVSKIIFFISNGIPTANFKTINSISVKFINQDTNKIEYNYDRKEPYNDSSLIVLAEINFGNKTGLEIVDQEYKISLEDFINKYAINQFHENKSNGTANKDEPDEDWCYKILESTKDSTNEQIKEKYKTLIKNFHPDLIQSKNLHKDFVDFANKKFIEIKKAYNFLKEKRNIS